MLGNVPEWPLDSPMTRSREPSLSPLTQALIGPPGLLILPAGALTGALLLYGVSAPGGYFEAILLSVILGLVLAVIWIPRFVVGLLRADGRPGLRRHWARWAAGPVMGAAVIGLMHFNVPYTVRFALSEASLERFAQAVATGAESETGDRWVGLFPLKSAERIDGGARFLVKDVGFIDSYGFAWSPQGEPSDEYADYEHLHGSWYEWRENF
jgi:hypothetical protein